MEIITFAILFLCSLFFFAIYILLGVHQSDPPTVSGLERDSDNGEIEKVIYLLSGIIRLAKSEINIVSGTLDPDCWNAQPVADALTNVLKDSFISCRIITGPTTNIEELDKLKPLIDLGRIEIRHLGYHPFGHYVIVDQKHLRLEEPTEPGAESECHIALIRRDRPQIARRLNNSFSKLWEKA